MKSIFRAIIFLSLLPHSSFGQSAALDTGSVTDISNIPLNQDNPVVAISRANKNTIVIGAVSDEIDSLAMVAYYSSDRGASWETSRLPVPLNPDFYMDGRPSITSDDAGNFYYAYVTTDGSVIPDSAGNISIASSSNGGTSWHNLAPINPGQLHWSAPDDVFIIVDNSPSSQYHGRVYIVWDQIFANADTEKTSGGAYIAWSDNKGISWKGMNFIGTSDAYQQVRTGKNGEVYVSCSDSLGLGHELFVSVDGGATFTDVYHNRFTSYPTYLVDTQYTLLKGILGIAAFPYISFDVDLASNRIHLVFGDYQGDLATLQYVYSDNNGAIWSEEAGIQELSVSDRFDPWVSVDQKTHEAYVTFYSSDSDPNNILVAPYRLRIRDSATQMMSAAFSPYSVEQSDSTSPYIGDHTASDAYDSLYIGVWTQNRSGYTDGDVFAFISTQKPAKQGVLPIVIHSKNLWLSAPYPNPANGKSISLRYYIPHASEINFNLYDVKGSLVRHFAGITSEEGSYSGEFDISNITAGTYFIQMTTGNGVASRKLIIP